MMRSKTHIGTIGRTGVIGVALTVALSLSACGGSTAGSAAGSTAGSAAGSSAALKVAAVTSQTGTYASLGAQAINAVNFAADEANANGGVDGHHVDVVALDAGSSPQEAVQQTQKAIQQDGSPYIIGTISSAQSLAIAGQIESLNGLQLVTISKADALTGKNCNSRVFRTDHSDSMDAAAIGPYLKTQAAKSWSFIGADYAWGRDGESTFEKVANQNGMTVTKKMFPPLGTKDFGSYISQLADNQTQGLMVYLAGGDSNNFVKQARQFGLFDKYQTTLGVSYVTQGGIAATGDAMLGLGAIINYAASIPTSQNKTFVDAWAKKFNGTYPTNFEGETYLGMQTLFAAVAKAKSVDPKKVADAMGSVSFDSVYGNVSMRSSDHTLVLPNYVGEPVKSSDPGGYTFKIALTVPADQATPAGPGCGK